MAWIDYKMDYDMVAQNGIMGFLKMYKISSKVIKFMTENMKNWKMELTAGWRSLA